MVYLLWQRNLKPIKILILRPLLHLASKMHRVILYQDDDTKCLLFNFIHS